MEHDVLPGNEDLVHHLVIYECQNYVSPLLDGKGWVEVPEGQPKPEGIEDWVRPSCFKSVVYAWAVGGKVCVHLILFITN